MLNFTSDVLFCGFALTIFLVALIWTFKSLARLKEVFATKRGKGIAVGIVLVLLGAILTVTVANAAEPTGVEYFQWGELYVGLDHTKNISPMCEEGYDNDRLTSNLGIRANILQSKDTKFTLNGKITHHSCAFNEDAESYDAVGVELTYKLW